MPSRTDYQPTIYEYPITSIPSRKNSAILPAALHVDPQHATMSTRTPGNTLCTKFVQAHDELASYRCVLSSPYHLVQLSDLFLYYPHDYRSGEAIVIDGHNLSIPAVTAAARFGAAVNLDASPETKDRVLKSRLVIVDKVNSHKSVYGVSTGFGGSGEY